MIHHVHAYMWMSFETETRKWEVSKAEERETEKPVGGADRGRDRAEH